MYDLERFEMQVRGRIPAALEGSLIVSASRRHKDRRRFSRWHDSQADLIRLDLLPGRPGRIQAHLLTPDPFATEGVPPQGVDRPREHQADPAHPYDTQPNHGINIAHGTVWATNLLFGSPLEVDLESWQPRRILRYCASTDAAPQVSSTSHFAWSPCGRWGYFHQSLLEREERGRAVRATDLRLVELDTLTGTERTWGLVPPPDDPDLHSANFHSAFCFEEDGRRYVGLLKTGAVLERLAPHAGADEHPVVPSSPSTIWTVEIDPTRHELTASLLEGIGELDGIALSHLHVDASGGEGFTLFANYKEADVAEETHGANVYGEPPEDVREHYSGMIVEALGCGQVIRYERRRGATSLKTFRREYDSSATSQGHTWLPINLATDRRGRRLFASFSGFRPRLLPRHVADAYPERARKAAQVGYVPPLLLRLDAETLVPDDRGDRSHLGYAEPMAFAFVEDPRGGEDVVCTFAPEVGLRIFPADDLTQMVGHGYSPRLITWQDTHFRTEPAHMAFVHR